MSVFDYKEIRREDSVLKNLNPFKNTKTKLVPMAERVKTLKRSNLWRLSMKNWDEEGKKINISLLPKIGKFKLGEIMVNESIQRPLVSEHCANRIGHIKKFGEYYIQTPFIQVRSDGTKSSINGQHTTTFIATCIEEGRVTGYDGSWEDFEMEMQYIETDNDAIARRAFNLWNGGGQEKQTPFNEMRGKVLSVRVDKDTTFDDEVKEEEKLSATEKNLCIPVPEKGQMATLNGAFTNFGAYKSADIKAVEIASEWHNRYFHHKKVHVALWFIFDDLYKAKGFKFNDKFLEEIAGMIKNLFGDLEQFALVYKEAYQDWYKDLNGVKTKGAPDKGYSCALVQLYKALGGTEKIPTEIETRFPRLFEFYDESYLNAD